MSEWRPIPGFEHNYEVSDLGEIRSRRRRGTHGGLLKTHVGKRGYPTVSLVQDCRQTTHEVHRLVALAFLGPRPEGKEVRHLDGDRLRPHAVNLAYGTRSENLIDSIAHGSHPTASRTHCPRGHPYDEANTRRVPSRPNARYCRACEAMRGRGPKSHPDYREEWKP